MSSTNPNNKLSISLHPVPPTPTAALTLVTLHNEAFAHDPFLELMYGPLSEEVDSFAADIQAIMRDDPTARFTQAVVAAGSEKETVVGWSWWNVYPDRTSYLAAKAKDEERARQPPKTALCPAAYVDWKVEVGRRRERWIERHGEGEGGVAILQVLVVAPSYQNRGIGTQLLRHGLQEAKALKIPAWLEASEEGYGVYTKCGFRDVQDDIVLDMKRYGREDAEGVGRWGICMLMD
ncbi:hypothetical protein P170DRAFT_468121 [Aspergillus steynii IBT 23096]|uniref:N-acetyltransferase domain-containing protein n=1 Tax=Aspergillus steynii IBT 23096 TaxID=1392250 RepID=A0A2I2FUW1_9EURO|nr:uncharacterized protein P170DRAFT_468121 [Aspergillus steynii IBT 23096]PLB44438.1 hypothetical protein P170DRAFT_468121 [Aspergillus steynii IBT 23096]